MKTLDKLMAATLVWLCIGGSSARATGPMQVGTLTVEMHGDHGSPIILIPGLSCGAWVWDDMVTHLEKDHALYVVTLAGFDGTKPVKGNLFDQADESLAKLIESKHIDKPALIGHSLGGTLSIKFAEEHSNLISGVIAVDGMPIFPGTQNIPAEQRPAIVAAMKSKMADRTPEENAAQQVQFMKSAGVIDPKKAEEVAKLESKSDIKSTAEYMSEDLKLDLRPGLSKIKVPLVEICPYYEADGGGAYPMTQDQKVALYKSLLVGAAKGEVITIPGSRHFVMYDQPDAMYKVIDDFLAKK